MIVFFNFIAEFGVSHFKKAPVKHKETITESLMRRSHLPEHDRHHHTAVNSFINISNVVFIEAKSIPPRKRSGHLSGGGSEARQLPAHCLSVIAIPCLIFSVRPTAVRNNIIVKLSQRFPSSFICMRKPTKRSSRDCLDVPSHSDLNVLSLPFLKKGREASQTGVNATTRGFVDIIDFRVRFSYGSLI